MAETEKQPLPKWRRFVRAMMPWEQDPVLAVMGGLLLLLMLGGAVGLLGLLAYITWDLAPEYPWFFILLYGGVAVAIGLIVLFRTRCPHCGKFFSAKHLSTEVDIVSAPRSKSDLTGERVVHVRRYHCRRCDHHFTRRS